MNSKLLFLAVGLCVVSCGKEINVAGNSADIGNAKVRGTILKSNGNPARDTRVVLLPTDFNPTRAVPPDSLTDTTDEGGAFEISLRVAQENVSQIPTFNLEAANLSDGTRLIVQNISVVAGDAVALEPDTLRKPGTIRVDVSQIEDPLNGHIYIPGTLHHVQLNQSMIDLGYAMLDSVPAGAIAQILYANPGSASQADTIANDLSVISDSTAIIAKTATYVVAKALVAPIIDGDLSEFTNAAAIYLYDTLYLSQCSIKIMWDDSALYLGADVKDTRLNVVPGRSGEQIINMDDAIELMFDPNGNRGDFLAEDDVKFYVNVLSRRADAKFQDTSWNSSWKTSVVYHGTVNDNSDIDTGYTVEMAIPWSDVLQTPPTAGKQLVFDVVLDNDSGFVDEWTQIPWSNQHFTPNSQWINIPKYWGKLILK